MSSAFIQLLVYYASLGVVGHSFSGTLITEHTHFVKFIECVDPLDPDEWAGIVIWSEDHEAVLYLSKSPGESVIVDAALILDFYGITTPTTAALFKGGTK